MAVSVPVLYFLVPLALALAGLAVYGFLWAVRTGQYDDVRTPALRVVLEEDQDDPTPTADRNEKENPV